MTKDVHVSAYTKKDGTHVDAYDRARPGEGSSSEENGQNLTLEGGVTMNNYLGPELSNKDYLRGGKHYEKDMEQVAELRSQLDVTSWFTYKDSKKLLKELTNSTGVINHKTIEKNLNRLKESQETLHTVHKNHLERLIASESQAEYEKLYKIYVAEEKHLKNTDYNIRVMEYYLENKNYAGLKSEVEKYHKTSEKHHTKWKALNNPIRYVLHEHPDAQAASIKVGMNWEKYKKHNYVDDAIMLSEISLSNFEKGKEYIKRNGKVLNSTSELPKEVRTIVKDKVQSQMHVADSKGILFHAQSTLAIDLRYSKELKKYSHDNLQSLLSGEVINGSTYFGQNRNLQLSLGHADIVGMHLDEDYNLRAYVVDTYDFNEDDLDWEVEWAHNLQDQGKLTNYFTVVEVKIPRAVWMAE